MKTKKGEENHRTIHVGRDLEISSCPIPYSELTFHLDQTTHAGYCSSWKY